MPRLTPLAMSPLMRARGIERRRAPALRRCFSHRPMPMARYHDAVVEEHHVHLRLVLARLRLGQDVRGGARHHHHLDAVGCFSNAGKTYWVYVFSMCRRSCRCRASWSARKAAPAASRAASAAASGDGAVHGSFLSACDGMVGRVKGSARSRQRFGCALEAVDREGLDRRAAAAVAHASSASTSPTAGPIWKPAPAEAEAVDQARRARARRRAPAGGRAGSLRCRSRCGSRGHGAARAAARWPARQMPSMASRSARARARRRARSRAPPPITQLPRATCRQ